MTLRPRFDALWRRAVAAGDPAPVWDGLDAGYGDPGRAYHGWAHVAAMLAGLDAAGVDPEFAGVALDEVALAVFFHDAVYDPRAGDNEARSAALAATMLANVVPPPTLARAVRLIEATAAHAIPPGLPADEAADMALFLDMDLSILGADIATFDRYEAGVRHEYRHVPDAQFGMARAGILERFLARDTLYFSAWGQRRPCHTPCSRALVEAS